MGKKSSKSTSTTTVPKWASELGQQAGHAIMDTVSGNQGNLDALAGDIRGHLPQLGQMAFGEQPGLKAATNYAQDVLGGRYLDQQNPYLNSMVQMGEQDARDAVNANFSKYGRTGGGNHYGNVAKEVANAGNTLRYQNYATERQNQNTAAGLMPGLTAAQYAGVSPYLAATQTAGQLPYAGLSSLADMGSLWSGQGTTTQTTPGGWGQQVLGAAASALPFILSDRRLKKNIERIGEWDSKGDGLGRYRYSYTFDPSNTIVEGVMADEVEKLRPQAFVPNYRGEYAAVNYGAL